MGPTAAGKTEITLRLAEMAPIEVISVDSAQVFRDMNIGTAKPEADILERVPHHLIDIRDPTEVYSAADFRDDSFTLIQDIHKRGAIPVLSGGTMLYYRACFKGLSPLPAADAEVRQRLDAQAAAIGWEKMHQRLGVIDPHAAERIHPNDPQRIQRALEVYEISGRTLTDWHRAQQMEPGLQSVLKLVIAPQQRQSLHEKIAQRFDQMLAAGFIEEVVALRARYPLTVDMPAMRAVGYRQAWDYLNDRCSHAEMRERAIAATRQLAKRQYTWLRRESGTLWYDLSYREVTQNIMSAVRGFAERYQLL